MINIKFPDGSVRQYEAGVTGYDVAMSISPRRAEQILAVNIKRADEPENRPTLWQKPWRPCSRA